MNEGIFKEGSLVVTFLMGHNEFDEPVYTSRTFRNLNGTATAAELTTTAGAIGNLLGLTVARVERIVKEEV